MSTRHSREPAIESRPANRVQEAEATDREAVESVPACATTECRPKTGDEHAGPDVSGPAPDAASAVNDPYDADRIIVLEGLEAVRRHPGMYVGGTNVAALHHLVYEVVDNAIDEAMAGFARNIVVTIHVDGSCSVVDDGRGIPVDPIRDDNPAINGRPAVEVVMTVLHSGSKFRSEKSAYKVSGGLHGVGVSCVNALSEWLECEVYRDGKVWTIEFERGRVVRPLTLVGQIPEGSTRRTGTRVTFMPDASIFPDTRFDYATLAARLRELAYLNPGVTIRLLDERVGPDGRIRGEVFRATHGLLEYVEHLMHGKNALTAPIYIRREFHDRSVVCEVAMQYHDGYTETLLAFANNIFNRDGGTHAQGFKTALTRVVNAYARREGLLHDKDPVPTGEDLREGLVAIVSVKLPNPAFNNQPKERLLTPQIEEVVSQAVGEGLREWLEEHPGEARRVCQKGVAAAQAREAARKARDLARRKTALDSGSMPHKLRDCKTRDVERSELFIVEGDAAGGSATQGRDVETQAILPLRGKLLNVEKARIDKVLGFEEIRTLVAALRCGMGEEFDESRLRYGKVIIMTDADVDGSHIRTLLLTFFFRQMPRLIQRGRVYIAQPPLYQVVRGKTERYVLNERVLHDTLTELGLDGAALEVRDTTGEPGTPPTVIRRLAGAEARRAVRLLRRLRDLVEIAERRGVRFVDLLAARAQDPEGRRRLPTHMVAWQNGEAWAWSERQAHDILAQRGLRLEEGVPANGEGGVSRRLPATIRELHENRELERLFADLNALGLSIDDYALVQEEAITGERMPARFAWVVSAPAGDEPPASERAPQDDAVADEPSRAEDGRAASRPRAAPRARGPIVAEAPNLASILDALHDVGRRGLEIKRFKGLGEMNPDQLWLTTMDPSRRTLVRVTMDAASEADQLFSILMGEEVEPRRRFIEEHALEVKNLDV